ncbi:hypothetical protein TNCV_1570721 [Trichonephila clavipes]|uniref:Uncharacterized protein n=1 Tax=Trichonephila clavipes TaxID=2585209 RepID=A0A8X6SVN1_TRICX|nr:hypothetical protein TNCV_1570721 [Trichonephila clavipes]
MVCTVLQKEGKERANFPWKRELLYEAATGSSKFHMTSMDRDCDWWKGIPNEKLGVDQGRNYRRINDTGPQTTGAPTVLQPFTDRTLMSRKGPRRNFDTGPPLEVASGLRQWG